MKKSTTNRIETLIAREKRASARALLQAELKKEPQSHWLLARLALTHYEQRNYKKAPSLGQLQVDGR
ncbi:MAG: hypothetical protein WB615_13455 [Candidatus Tumulicola sp.]